MITDLAPLIYSAILVLVRNEIVYQVRIRWICDIYSEKVPLRYSDMPSYYSMMFDLTLWRYIPLDQYLKKKQ